jgi:hypothetical protein
LVTAGISVSGVTSEFLTSKTYFVKIEESINFAAETGMSLFF